MNGEEFLNRLYKDLQFEDEVLHTAKGTSNKHESVQRYMQRLEKVHNLTGDNEHKIKLLKELYYKKYLNTDNQKESLDRWLDFLFDKNTKYPMWAKYWVFQGMLKIGNYSHHTNTYQKRSKSTLAPFIELNYEVLNKCFEIIIASVEKEEILNDELELLVKSGNFQKMYIFLLEKHKQNLLLNSDKNDGKWIKFSYETEEEIEEKIKNGIEPEYVKLYNSLQGYNTGWCTADDHQSSKNQIVGGDGYDGGDFYVYYTKDENDQYKVPRIAIRMDQDEIGEIRGIENKENLEDGFEEILTSKLIELNIDATQRKKYIKIVSDLKRITELYKKQKNNIEFTSSDILFLNDPNGEIETFGLEEDPRINEILCQRSLSEDMKKLNREELLFMLNSCSSMIEYLSTDREDYKEIVIEVVRNDPSALKWIPQDYERYSEIIDAIQYNENNKKI